VRQARLPSWAGPASNSATLRSEVSLLAGSGPVNSSSPLAARRRNSSGTLSASAHSLISRRS